jgi:23S rRNA (adenine2503-C2)-methyltransferase
MERKPVRGLNVEELETVMAERGQPRHRGRQLFIWIQAKGARDFSDMTDISRELARELSEEYLIEDISLYRRLRSEDGTEKYLWELDDGAKIESVLIKEKKRRTLCISSQVGCKYRCPFCASGKKGLVRQLSASEIISQIDNVRRLSGERITNIVFMGIGEPFDNIDNVFRSIILINHPRGKNIGARRITISTCGVVPGINALKDLGLQVGLSVSVHAADDDLRNRIVPVNRKYPIKGLVKACRDYFETTGRIVTFEYSLISGVNDSPGDARKLSVLAKRAGAKVNLLTCNPLPDSVYRGVPPKEVMGFKNILEDRGVRTTFRRPRGADVLAACGQLAAEAGREKRGVKEKK